MIAYNWYDRKGSLSHRSFHPPWRLSPAAPLAVDAAALDAAVEAQRLRGSRNSVLTTVLLLLYYIHTLIIQNSHGIIAISRQTYYTRRHGAVAASA